MVLDAVFLVDCLREMEFDESIDSLQEKNSDRLKFNYVGPAPPFNFVEVVIHWGQLE